MPKGQARFIFALAIALSAKSWGQDASVIRATPIQCIQGSSQKMQLHQLVTRPRVGDDESLLSYFQQHKIKAIFGDGFSKNTSVPPRCFGEPTTFGSLFSKSLQIMDNLFKPKEIKTECVQAALLRANQTDGFVCENSQSKPVEIGSAGPQGPCVSPEMADYISWATNSAIQCLSRIFRPVDPLVIFKKLNNETGFSFFTSSTGGTGIGQLTSTAIEQISMNSGMIEKVLASSNPACAPFKKSLRMDPLPTKSTPVCRWIEPNDGLARNLIYSIAYFLETRDRLTQFMSTAFGRLKIENWDYYNYGALATYGPGGLAIQRELVNAARLYPRDFKEFHQEARERVAYLSQVENKYKEALKNANLPANYQCVTP